MPHSLNIHKHDDKFKEIINGIEQDATILESFVMDENNKYSALLKSTQHSKLIGRSLFDCLSVDTDIAKVDVKKLLIENADKIDAIAFLEQYCAFAMHSSPEAGRSAEINYILLEVLAMKTEEVKALKQKNNMLNEKNAGLQQTLNIISHDLKTPFNNIIATLGLINSPNFSDTDLKECLGMLSTTAVNASELLKHLAEWANSNSQLTPAPKKFNMADHVDQEIGLLNTGALEKHIKLENAIEKNIEITADPNMVDLIVRNLINNAIKFTPNDGKESKRKIIVSSQYAEGGEKDFLEISVSDNGVGMSPDVQQKIFAGTNFTSKGTKGEKGTGLGLAMCKKFVEKHGGKIWVESEPGKGTTFTFTLPLSLAETHA